MAAEAHLDLEIRHIRASSMAQLSTIVDKTKAWKDLLDKLAKPLDLTLESIHLIEQQYHCGKSPTLALLNHWSITGRRRPTIRDLVKYLRMCNLKWAEDYVWREILHCHDSRHEQPVQLAIPNSFKPSKQELENGQLIIDDEYKFQDLKDVLSKLDEPCPRYSFDEVYLSTNKFCHRPHDFESGEGRRIGDGRFSSVFLAQTRLHNQLEFSRKQTLAAKLLKSECKLNYLVNEINLAMKIRHENILELLGISVGNAEDEPSFMCLIYPYMENGSLLECINMGLRCEKFAQIQWLKRIEMAIKIGRGVAYLHTFPHGTIIHRDIKTANILIDTKLNPKLGDFTLVRQLDSMRNNETQYSQSVIGTSVYMPPEAFRGDISTKFDVFSFGIVLLELVSGRKPFDEESSEDLLTYVSEKLSDIDDKLELERPSEGSAGDRRSELKEQFLSQFLDGRAGDWVISPHASLMFELALRATEVRKRDRPEMNEIVRELERIS